MNDFDETFFLKIELNCDKENMLILNACIFQKKIILNACSFQKKMLSNLTFVLLYPLILRTTVSKTCRHIS